MDRRETIRSFTVHFRTAEEGGYVVEVPALPGCVTEGDTFEEALANAREAITVYLESLADRGIDPPDDEDFVVTRVSVASSR